MLNTSSFKKSIITNILLKKKTFHRLQHNIASFKILVGKHTQAYTHTYYITTNKKLTPMCLKIQLEITPLYTGTTYSFNCSLPRIYSIFSYNQRIF